MARHWTIIVATALCMSLAVAPRAETSGGGRASPHHLPRVLVGRASFYREQRGLTASGRRFNPRAMTAASPTLPLGTRAKVTNLATGKQVRVIVTDRGPFIGHRILDVSPAAADDLGMRKAGVAPVRVEPVSAPR